MLYIVAMRWLLAIIVYVMVGLHVATAKGYGWEEKNCSALLHSYYSSSSSQQSFSSGDNNNIMCPPWYHYNSHNKNCYFSNSLEGRVISVSNTLQTAVLQCYCMTNNSQTHQLAVTACPYTCLVSSGYYTLPCQANITENFTCDRFKRQGLGCSDCSPGYSTPVSSYTSHCVSCDRASYVTNWIKYLTFNFVPLTLFTLCVIVFQVKATSPYLFSYIFFIQTMTMSVNMRLIQTLLEDGKIKSSGVTRFGISLLSFWNLDFFRVFYTPFCLYQSMTTLMADFMDIFVALYPFLLIGILALLVRLGVGHTGIITMLCSPIDRLYHHLDCEWSMRSNLISALATFTLLSNAKIVSVCFDMFLPTYVYPINSHTSNELHVFRSGNIKYLGSQHIPYALCSLVILIVFVGGPLVLLLCYPRPQFRRVLRKLNLDGEALHSFVNHFHESYKTKMEDGKEYRWFPLTYFILRIILLLLYGATLSSFYFPIAAIVLTVFLIFTTVCRPRKSEVHNAIDIFHTMCFFILFLGIMSNITANSQAKRKIFRSTSVVIIIISSCLPILYFLGLVVYFVIIYRLRLTHGIKNFILNSKLCKHICLGGKYCDELYIDHSKSYNPFLEKNITHEDEYGSCELTPEYGTTCVSSDSAIN